MQTCPGFCTLGVGWYAFERLSLRVADIKNFMCIRVPFSVNACTKSWQKSSLSRKVKRFLFHQKPFILWKLKKQFAENNSWAVHLSGPYRKIRTAKETNQNSPCHRDQFCSHVLNFSQVTKKARDFPWAFTVFYQVCKLVQNKNYKLCNFMTFYDKSLVSSTSKTQLTYFIACFTPYKV